jgi:hypothetical protein
MTVFALNVFNPAVFFADGEGLTFAANANSIGEATSSVLGLQFVLSNAFADGLATGAANSDTVFILAADFDSAGSSFGAANSDTVFILAADFESAGVSLSNGASGATAGTIAASLGNAVVTGFQVTRFPTALRPTSASGIRAQQASFGLRPAQLSIGRR